MSNISFLIVEDSSKSSHGGGQSVTLIVADIVASQFGARVIVVDHINPFRRSASFSSYCRFRASIAWYLPLLLSVFKVKSDASRSTFSLSYLEFLLGPILSLLNSILVILTFFFVRVFFGQHVIVYTSTKKALVESFLLSFFRIPIFYHSHNVHSGGYISNLFRLLVDTMRPYEISVSHASSISSSADKRIVLYNPCPQNHLSYEEVAFSIDRKVSMISAGIMEFSSFSNHLAWKGLDVFLRSISHFNALNLGPPKHNTNFIFKIYGSGDSTPSLLLLSESLGLSSAVFCGHTNSVLHKLYDSVHCLVLPSTASEACPMIMIEALSLGVPIITSRIGGQFELLPDCLHPYSFDPGDSESLAKSLLNFSMLDSLHYRSICHQVYRSSFAYSFTSYEKKLASFFQNAYPNF